ncbi:MAG: DNA repair protein RecO [Flavobacteriales bacterium]
MLVTTKAIGLRAIAHGDRTVVLKAWTAHAGAMGFVVRLSKGGAARAALQPLARIEVVADVRPDRELHPVRELRVDEPYSRIPFDPVRGALLLFAQELFGKVLRAEGPDAELDAAARAALHAIDADERLAWMPQRLLIGLSGPLGFRPEPPREGEDHFDLEEGRFVPRGARHGHLLAPPLSGLLAGLLLGNEPVAPAHQRRALLDHLLLYYRLHIEGMDELRSPAMLHEVLR